MFAGLGTTVFHAPLSDQEEDYLSRFFVYGLNLTPALFDALPDAEQAAMEELLQSWHLNKLYLTRTATRSR